MKYAVLILAAVVFIAAAPPPPTPPPTPPPLTDPQAPSGPASAANPNAMPLATPTPNLDSILGGMPAGAKQKPGAKGTPSPPPDVRKGLDGVWELEIQRGPKTEYEHMNLVQKGQDLNGIFLTKDNKKYPVAGSLDPQNNVRLVVSLPDGSTILLEARVDGTTDMLGMFTDAQERVPFTAAYRPKEKWIDNINATPGGLGGGGGGPP
ncbi:MAG: hypothetical protein WA629_00365 [Candidatus Aquilonibacter sp.]